MRYVLIGLVFAVLAGCATAGTNGDPKLFYDHKYNTYYQLSSSPGGSRQESAAPFYDRKYNTYLPGRNGNGRGS